MKNNIELDSYDSPIELIKRIRIISEHSIVFFAGFIYTSIVGYFFMVFMARKLGSEALGHFSLGMSLVSLSVIISTMGLTSAASRFVAAYRGLSEHTRIQTFLKFSLFVISLFSIILGCATILGRNWIADSVFNDISFADHLPLFGLLIPLNALTQFLMQVLTGYQKVASRTIIDNFLRISLKVLLSSVLIILGWGLNGWIIGEISGAVLSIILGLWLVTKLTPFTSLQTSFFIYKPNLERVVFSFAAVMLIIGVITFTFQQISLLITGIYLNAEQVGIYAAATAVGAFIPSILFSINSIFSPIIAELHSKGEHTQLTRLFHTLTKWGIAFTWPFVVVVVIFSPLIMGVYGDEFEKGWSVLVIIAIGQLVNVGVGSVGLMLIMSGYQRLELLSGFFAAITSILLSIVLIPKTGVMGAGIATAVGLATSNLLRSLMVKKAMNIIPYNRSVIKLIPAAVISGIVVVLSQKWFLVSGLPVWGILLIALILSFSSFFLALVMQGIDGDDRLILDSFRIHIRMALRTGIR